LKQKKIVLSKQLLRSGTAIGAQQSEACFAESKADFIHKYGIAQKECNESIYWLKLLSRTNYIAQNEFESIENDAIELLKMITSSIITAKRNLKLPNH
jgi:four helix bundle protein